MFCASYPSICYLLSKFVTYVSSNENETVSSIQKMNDMKSAT